MTERALPENAPDADAVPAPTNAPDFRTLPDLLAPGLDLIFVGINPSIYSAERGHYFARRTNRFWPALSRSRLSAPIRAALGRDALTPEDDRRLTEFGIGFTDVVKTPTRNITEVRPADYAEWSPQLLAQLAEYAPRVACFQGITGYRAFARYALNLPGPFTELGEQWETLGGTRIFVVPSPSPANAHFRLEDQIAWFDRLADFLAAT